MKCLLYANTLPESFTYVLFIFILSKTQEINNFTSTKQRMKQGLIISQNYTRLNNVFIHKLKDKDLITNINQNFRYSNPFLISHLQHDILSNSACPFSNLIIILMGGYWLFSHRGYYLIISCIILLKCELLETETMSYNLS